MQFEIRALKGNTVSAVYTTIYLDHIISWVTFSFFKLCVYFFCGFCPFFGVVCLIPWPQILILFVFSNPVSTLLVPAS